MRACKWSDALAALDGMRAYAQLAKQGTIQRWVRDCDRVQPEFLRLRLLDSILRAGKSGGSAELSADANADRSLHADAGSVDSRSNHGGAASCDLSSKASIAGVSSAASTASKDATDAGQGSARARVALGTEAAAGVAAAGACARLSAEESDGDGACLVVGAGDSRIGDDSGAGNGSGEGGDEGGGEGGDGSVSVGVNGGVSGGVDGVGNGIGNGVGNGVVNSAGNGGGGDVGVGGSVIRRHPPWVPCPCLRPSWVGTQADPNVKALPATAAYAISLAADASESGADASESGACAQRRLSFRVVYVEPAAERQPPNHCDLRIFATAPGTAVAFAPSASIEQFVTKQPVRDVPSAFLLSGVLLPRECAQLVSALRAMGFSADRPLSLVQPHGIGSCEWLADDSLLEPIWQRVRRHLPQRLGKHTLEGINARWRSFAYGEGGIYRPHIDGTWPGSGVSADGRYVHDAHGSSVRSRLTFLMYLNDDFEGGGTTFYLPSEDPGTLDAHAVQPQAGAVLCFPQANTASLVHEGSPVTRGAKIVIRTDVLYRRD